MPVYPPPLPVNLATNDIIDEIWVDAVRNAIVGAMPWGIVAKVAKTTDQTGIGTTVTDLTGMTITFTAVAGRQYRISTWLLAAPGANGITLYLRDGAGAAVHQTSVPSNTATASVGVAFSALVTPAAGAITYKLAAGAITGTAGVLGNAAYPMQLWAEDIGAA